MERIPSSAGYSRSASQENVSLLRKPNFTKNTNGSDPEPDESTPFPQS
jgi:hypothetical protein